MSDPPPAPVPSSSEPAADTVPDGTLAEYIEHHDRPPAFEGPDAHPYTVAIEVERTPNLAAPYEAYLVFPRWAHTGVGIVGHVETETLASARSADEAREAVGGLVLTEVKRLLDEAVSNGTSDA